MLAALFCSLILSLTNDSDTNSNQATYNALLVKNESPKVCVRKFKAEYIDRPSSATPSLTVSPPLPAVSTSGKRCLETWERPCSTPLSSEGSFRPTAHSHFQTTLNSTMSDTAVIKPTLHSILEVVIPLIYLNSSDRIEIEFRWNELLNKSCDELININSTAAMKMIEVVASITKKVELVPDKLADLKPMFDQVNRSLVPRNITTEDVKESVDAPALEILCSLELLGRDLDQTYRSELLGLDECNHSSAVAATTTEANSPSDAEAFVLLANGTIDMLEAFAQAECISELHV